MEDDIKELLSLVWEITQFMKMLFAVLSIHLPGPLNQKWTAMEDRVLLLAKKLDVKKPE